MGRVTDQWLRYCQITIDDGGEPLNVSDLRCRFKLTPLPLLTPAIGEIKITNLSAARGRAIAKKEYKRITIDAGYQDGHGIIFKGNIIQGVYRRENPTDTLTTIIAADGDHGHNFATVSTKHAPGSTPQDHFNTAVQALGQFGITKGYIGIDLSTPKYPRAVSLWGMAADVLRTIAKSKDAMVFYDREQVTMIPRKGSRPDSAIILNSHTGLIGMPTQTTDGIFARCLINPMIRRGSTVKINQADIQGGIAEISAQSNNEIGLGMLADIASDGLYTVMKIDIEGDTRGNPWYMDLAMWGKNSAPPPKSSLLPYGASLIPGLDDPNNAPGGALPVAATVPFLGTE
jgi:hypothetical protein